MGEYNIISACLRSRLLNHGGLDGSSRQDSTGMSLSHSQSETPSLHSVMAIVTRIIGLPSLSLKLALFRYEELALYPQNVYLAPSVC